MERQRDNLQSKEKEESPESVLNEIEASKLSDIEFKIMIIRSLVRSRRNSMEAKKRNLLGTTPA